MEKGLNGSVLTNGVATPVAASQAPAEAMVGNESGVNPEKGEVIDAVPVETHDERAEVETKNFAQDIENVAKKDGTAAALEKLASQDEAGKEEKEKNENERKEEDSVNKEREMLKKQIAEKGQEEETQDPIRAQVDGLLHRVEELTSENQELKAKVNNIENVTREAVVSALALADMLRKLIEEAEEDKKKKEGLLALVAQIMAKLLTMILVDEKYQQEDKKPKEKGPEFNINFGDFKRPKVEQKNQVPSLEKAAA